MSQEDENAGGWHSNGEHELIQSEQTEVVVRKFDDAGQVVSKVVTVTTEYMQRVNVDHTGLYL